jgi:hypothetical protein
MGDNETIYAIVNACDTAAQVTEGTQNCTTYATANAKLAVLPDITAPQGFDGIKGDSFITTPAQGTLGVTWFEPAVWSADYQGFKVYRVNTDNSLSLLKDCPCAAPGACTSTDTSCTVTGLDAYRTYTLHVRAYDAIGNHTQLSVTTKVSSKRTTDTTLPTFASNLTVTATNPRTLSWSAATDNQYSLETGATLQYLVYRKTGATGFTNATNPSADGVLRTTTTSTSYTETGLLEGSTYHFTVCAQDASLNTRCDGTVQSFLVPDSTPPTISTLTSTKTTLEQKRWNVNWTVSDNKTAAENMTIQVYRTFTDAAETPSVNPSHLVNSSEVSSNSLTNTQGPTGVMKYINYLIVATDQAGNQSSRALSVLSDNRMTVTRITRARGPAAGGKIVLISGTGFSKGSENGFGTSTTVMIGSNACTGITIASPELISCTIPAGTAGAVNVALTNPDGTQATLNGGYTYLSASTYVCDQDQSSNQMASGQGTATNPYLICTAEQLNRLRNISGDGSGASANYRTGSFHYRIMENINLAPFNGGTFSPIGSKEAAFSGHIDGRGIESRSSSAQIIEISDSGVTTGNRFGILNFNFSNNTLDHVGLVSTAGSAFSIKNLALINATVTGRNRTGGFVGSATTAGTGHTVDGAQAANYLANLFLSGTITASGTSESAFAEYLGGIAGFVHGVHVTNSEVYGTIIGNMIGSGLPGAPMRFTGGLFGGLNGAISDSKFVGSHSTNGVQFGGAVGTRQAPPVGYLNEFNRVTVKGSLSSSLTGSPSSAASLGGIVGWQRYSGSYIDTHFSGTLSAERGSIGGLVGLINDIGSVNNFILRCSSQGTITSGGTLLGGLVGSGVNASSNMTGDSSSPFISQSFSTMAISSTFSTRGVLMGGLAGAITGHLGQGSTVAITDSYFAGSLSANFEFGGLIGGNSTTALAGTNYLIVRSYSAGVLGFCVDTSSAFTTGTGGSNCGGGLVGAYYNTGAGAATSVRGSEAIASFWDSQRGGINSTFIYQHSSGTPTTARNGAYAKTTAQMQDQGANIYTAGTGEEVWDFNATSGVWKWPAAGGYPILRWQTE